MNNKRKRDDDFDTIVLKHSTTNILYSDDNLNYIKENNFKLFKKILKNRKTIIENKHTWLFQLENIKIYKLMVKYEYKLDKCLGEYNLLERLINESYRGKIIYYQMFKLILENCDIPLNKRYGNIFSMSLPINVTLICDQEKRYKFFKLLLLHGANPNLCSESLVKMTITRFPKYFRLLLDYGLKIKLYMKECMKKKKIHSYDKYLINSYYLNI